LLFVGVVIPVLLLPALLGSRTAEARVFAPICDEDGASAIAPLPVLIEEHSEIGMLPCEDSETPEGSAVDLPPERNAPRQAQAQSSPRVALHVASLPIRIPAASSTLLPMTAVPQNPGELHRRCVYRPPRC
jgi:hypothetical protein